jgi:hypothetical protein
MSASLWIDIVELGPSIQSLSRSLVLTEGRAMSVRRPDELWSQDPGHHAQKLLM